MPCSKGMTGCAALCGHRSLVESYRAERARQWSELIEFTGGYDTEIADRLRELQEKGTPLIDYKTWLKQSARPPEDRDMPVTWNNATLSESGIGDPAAEQVLLASIMEHPEFAEYLDSFRPQEFTEYLHQRIAEGIQDLHRQGHTPDAIAVEDWLRQHNAISPHPSWDSEFYRPDKAGERVPILKDGKQQWFERHDLGLRGWHQVAGPGLPSIEYHGEIVRDNTITRMTADAHLWAADRLKEAAAGPACDIAEKTSEISWRFNQMLSEQPKPLVSQFSDKEWVKHMEQAALTRSPSQSPALKYAQTPVTGPTQVQRSVVTMKVG